MKLSDAKKYEAILSAHERAEMTIEEIQKILIEDGAVLSNLYQEMEMEGDTVECHEDISYSKDNVQLHSHSFYEILYCKSGNVQYLLGADRYRFRRGDIVFVPPGVSHRPLYLEHLTEPYARSVIWVHENSVRRIEDALHFKPLDRPAYFSTLGSNWEYLKHFFESACREAEIQQEGYEACMLAIVTQLLIHLTRACIHTKPLEPLTVKRELLDDLIAYIEDHLAEKITLKSAASQFYISERAVSRLFSEKMDVSFYSYVTQRRLIAAKTLIIHGVPLDEIGGQVGFSDYSTFYRAFKQAFAISPKQFKQLQKG